MIKLVLHVAADLIPGMLLAAAIIVALSVPDLMVHAIRMIVK